MLSAVEFLLFSIVIGSVCNSAYAQDDRTSLNQIGDLRTIVVSAEAKPDSAIVVPPATSVRLLLSLSNEKRAQNTANTVNLSNWLSKEEAMNGLRSMDLHPWHIEVTYDQFDEDGDNVHSGVYEEYWAGPKKYKQIYKSDNFNQMDYATPKGLYRQGDQRWPDRVQSQVPAEVIAPFSYAATLEGFHGRNVERTFSGHKLQCVLIERDQDISDPTQYCFEPDSSVLRYGRGFGWFQTVYNRIVVFQGRNLAREVDVTDGGKPYLKLRVQTIESLSQLDDTNFVPPPDAVGPISDRVSCVQLQPINMSSYPQWPASLRAQHFIVQLDIVVGTNGHVISAHAVSGPPQAYKASEDAVRKWVFRPYFVLDKPVEVEARVSVSNN